MTISDFAAPWHVLLLTVIATAGIYVALIVFSRVVGLRSFAQMTNFDMAATMAFGSMMATTALNSSTPLLVGVVGLGALFGIQWILAQARRRRGPERLIDNGPLLLMVGDQILSDHLGTAQMTTSDLRARLRSAGVTRYDQVSAVVLEVTGNVSVLTEDAHGASMDPDLFVGVRGRDLLFSDEGPIS